MGEPITEPHFGAGRREGRVDDAGEKGVPECCVGADAVVEGRDEFALFGDGGDDVLPAVHGHGRSEAFVVERGVVTEAAVEVLMSARYMAIVPIEQPRFIHGPALSVGVPVGWGFGLVGGASRCPARIEVGTGLVGACRQGS